MPGAAARLVEGPVPRGDLSSRAVVSPSRRLNRYDEVGSVLCPSGVTGSGSKDAEIDTQKQQIADLTGRLAKVESLVAKLAELKQNAPPPN